MRDAYDMPCKHPPIRGGLHPQAVLFGRLAPGGAQPVDDELDSTSPRPVQNAVVTAALNDKVDKVQGKGLSANDFTNDLKAKLDGIEAQANKTVVDAALSGSSVNPVQNKAVHAALNGKVDKVTGKGLSTEDYTSAEKIKLAGIAGDANKTVVDDALSGSSTNPVQNKVVKTAIDNLTASVASDLAGKVDKSQGKGLSTNDYTDAEKQKLAGIEAGATAVTVDDDLSSQSENPVQNKVVTAALSDKADADDVHSVPSGGTTGQVLAKKSGTDYDAEWVTPSGGGGGGAVNDVTVDGSSVVSNGTAVIPDATAAVKGVVKVDAAVNDTSTNPVQNREVYQGLIRRLSLYGDEAASQFDFDDNIHGVWYSTNWSKMQNMSNAPFSTLAPAMRTCDGFVLWAFGRGDDYWQICWCLTVVRPLTSSPYTTGRLYVRYSKEHTTTGVDNENYIPTWTAWRALAWGDEVPIVDDAITSGGTNPVEGGAIYTALAGKADSASVHSIPAGGTAGQFLVKSSGTDYDAEWVTVPTANGVSF